MNKWLAAGLDLSWVIVFAVIGRLSHAEGMDLSGVVGTAWPFAVAVVGLWVAASGLRWAGESLLVGLGIWIGTVALGMIIRRSHGDGTDVAFIIVATIFLGSGMLGWRAVQAWRTRKSVSITKP